MVVNTYHSFNDPTVSSSLLDTKGEELRDGGGGGGRLSFARTSFEEAEVRRDRGGTGGGDGLLLASPDKALCLGRI